jgi:hypothetical protein
MADTSKIEAMLESLVNDDKAKAEELFHEFVIEKSRDIYEGLLENDLDIDEADEDEVDEATDEEVDESDDDLDETTDEEVDESDEEVDESDEEVEENFDEFEMEADDDDDMGGDPADDMMGDMEAGDDDEGMDDAGEDDMEDRVVDLEDALDELKAEFEKMMAGEEGGDDMDDMGDEEGDMDMDDMGGEEEPEEEAIAFESDDEDEDEDEAKNESKSRKSEAEQMREYVEKVAGGHGAETKGKGESGANTKSPVAGKNDMGGTASNIVAGGEESGGKAQGPKEDNAGNVNVPGGKASKSMSNNSKGHGAEKKGSGETGTNSKSLMGS